jgi:universal stress protein E
MTRFATITVGVDLTDGSQRALDQAARLARNDAATLHVVHVIEALVVADLAQSLGQEEAALRAEVVGDAEQALARRCGELQMPHDWRPRVRVGQPWRELLAGVEETGSELLVMGLRGAGGSRRGVGTVARQCLRRGRSRTLLVAPGWTGAAQLVVAGVDFSEGSARALTEAIAFARRDGGRVEAVHVFAGPWHRLHYRAPTLQVAPEYQRAYRRALRARLERFVAPYSAAAADVPTSCRLVEAASDGPGLAAYSSRRRADLLVLGARSRSGLRDWLLGTTAENVLAESKTSLLAVPMVAAAGEPSRGAAVD